MSKYDPLTAALVARQESDVVLTFDELDSIVGGLPNSARRHREWWTNRASSQPHSAAWLNAGRIAAPDFENERAVFRLDPPEAEHRLGPGVEAPEASRTSSGEGEPFEHSVMHVLLKWAPDRETDTIAEHRAIAEEDGWTWWGRWGTAPTAKWRVEKVNSQIAEGRRTR